MNREEWLLTAVEAFRPLLPKLPRQVHVSTGWPSTKAIDAKARRIGECWYGNASADGAPHIFISPGLASSNDVLATLAHELVHACLSAADGHGKAFRDLAVSIGLEGKMTATHAGERLNAFIADVQYKLGDYPHARLDGVQRAKKKQTTRMLKGVCLCERIIRASAKTVDEGPVTCGRCGGEFDFAGEESDPE